MSDHLSWPTGSHPLAPKAGFDWGRVRWSEIVESACSYCGARLREDEMPLRLFRKQPPNLGAAFCEACQREWWGIQ